MDPKTRYGHLISYYVVPQALLEHNAKVYMGSRSKSKAEAAIKELKEATGKEAIFLELDLSSLPSVRKSAEEFLRYAASKILSYVIVGQTIF